MDWLIFEGHLSNGTHSITLTIDDGIHPPESTSVTVEVDAAAPVLGLIEPNLSLGYHSSDLIELDITDSIDYDGDEFTFSLTSDISGDLLSNVNPMELHIIQLDAGEHTLTFTLLDETGLSSVESVSLLVIESDPTAMIYEPMNNQFYEPGKMVLFDSNGTNDADNDITRREWRLYVPGEIYPTILSNDAIFSTNLKPGVHHVSLFVEDRRGGVDEVHRNITVASSSPQLSNLTATPKSALIDELVTITVSVELSDLDGTTQQINATITKNLQVWEFNLTDDNGDGIWTGEIELMPGEVGKAQLKATAIDGEKLDYLSIDIEFKEEDNDNTSFIVTASAVGGFILLSSVIAMLNLKRRKRLADIDLIDSWGVFGGDSKTFTEEVNSDLDDNLQAVPSLPSSNDELL